MKKEIIGWLKAGKIGVMPTDTMYGILCSAFNKKSIERIYKIRKRNNKKPLIILIDNVERLKDFGIENIPLKILNKIWPDKITVILPSLYKKFAYLHRGTKKLGFRLSKDRALCVLINKVGPLVAPSANIEGQPPATNITEAKKYFGDNVDFYFGTKRMPVTPSTIIEVKKGEKVVLIREGAVKQSGKKLKSLLQ